MSTHFKLFYLAPALGVLLAASSIGCGRKAEADTKTAAEAPAMMLGARDVATVARGPITTGLALTGSLEPHRVVHVKAQAPGTLRGLRVDRGAGVRQGALLAVVEAEGIRSMAEGAKSALAAAEAHAGYARQQLESARLLHDAGAMSDMDFKGVQTALEAAQSGVAGAKANLAAAGEQARRTTLVAPITGVVSDKLAEDGEAVNPGQTIVTVVNTDRLELAGQIPPAEAARVRPGQPVEFTISGYGDRLFRGRVDRIEPVANPLTRQIGVYLQIENTGRELVGGLFATGRIVGETQQEALLAPATAVVEREGEAFVYVVEGERLRRKIVVVGARDAQQGVVSITSGLSGGETLLATPTPQTTEGMRVQLAAPKAQPQTAAEGSK